MALPHCSLVANGQPQPEESEIEQVLWSVSGTIKKTGMSWNDVDLGSVPGSPGLAVMV